MANTANVRDELQVVINIDSDSTLIAGTPAAVLCNRQYILADYYFNVTATAQAGNDQFIIDSAPAATGGGGSAQGAIVSSAIASVRPMTVSSGLGNNWLAAAANVARGSYLRVYGSLGTGANRGIGFITILPGNRYAAGSGTYFPNNSAALRYQA